MTFAVISDVHSNYEALSAVLSDIRKRRINTIYFAGDAVGYGPDPDECLELITKESKVIVAGNHDWGVCGLMDINYFNVQARKAIEWTRQVIDVKGLDVLKRLPLKVTLKDEDITIVHSTPYRPEEWHYLIYIDDADINFRSFETRFCFIGHSHRPFIMEMDISGDITVYRNETTIKDNRRYIINAGSVGQPRDSDTRACYIIQDTERIEIVRVPYDFRITQKKMMRLGLPSSLIDRLAYGV